MRRASILIGGCLVVALALNVWAQQRSHPEIMQDVAPTRAALAESIEGGDGAAAAEAAMQLQGFFQELLPLYQELNLEPAIMRAEKAAAAAGEAAAAAQANNMEAAAAAHGMVQKACGGCHDQFREKAPDGSWRIKTGG